MAGRYPVVSIVTPSYNYSRFLPETIQSVLQQDYPHIEYLVVDDGSTDDSVKVVQSFGGAVRLLAQANAGQTRAINNGLRATTGEIVSYLNADDVLEDSTAVSAAVAALLQNPEAVMVYGDVHEIDALSRTIARLSWPWDEFRLEDSFSRVFNPVVQPGSLMWRRALDQVGYLNERFRYYMDWDYWFRLATVGRIIRVPRALAKFRVHGSSKTVRGLVVRLDDLEALYENAFASECLPQSCRSREQEIRCVVSSYSLMLGVTARDWSRAWKLLRRVTGHAARSNVIGLLRLMGDALRCRRGVTVSRYLTMARPEPSAGGAA